MQLFLGTRTAANINLIAQLLMITGLWIGFYFAHTHQIRRHRNMQTTVVSLNSFFILFVMITSFYSFVIAGGTTTGTVATLMMIHGLLGLTAELTGIYLILRMRTQLIPPRFRVRNFKLVMRSLITLWTLIVVLGLGIYYFRYLTTPTNASADENLARLAQEADGIAMHGDELQSAAQRMNLATTQRHAEHLVNMIEGKTGADYGDLDRDGYVEDPGDGFGALNYLKQVREVYAGGAQGQQVSSVADQVRDDMMKVIADAKTILQASGLQAVAPQVQEIAALTQHLGKGQSQSVPQIVTLLNASPASPSAPAAQVTLAPNTVLVEMRNFAFVPPTLSIAKGTTVLFVNRDPAKHTVTEDNGKFESRDIFPGQSFSHTFDEAGTFPFHCEYHGDRGGVDMSGTIIVQ